MFINGSIVKYFPISMCITKRNIGNKKNIIGKIYPDRKEDDLMDSSSVKDESNSVPNNFINTDKSTRWKILIEFFKCEKRAILFAAENNPTVV